MQILSGKTTGETIDIVLDCIELLSGTDTIQTATSSAATLAGVSYSSLLSGVPSLSPTYIVQRITSGVAGTTYVITFTITLTSGQVLIERAQIAVTA